MGMPYWRSSVAAIVVAGAFFAATPAQAIVKGSRTEALTPYAVRMIGNGYCSGAVIARRAIVTARHCLGGMSVLAGGKIFRIARASRDAVLDDGTRVRVEGDAIILRLNKPLPETLQPAHVGQGEGGIFTIAGFGVTNEHRRGASALHKADLVVDSRFALIDPDRKGSVGASACYGDSGGPVLRGGWLVGVITRAAHPSPRIACGALTRWAPIALVSVGDTIDVPLPPEKPAALRMQARGPDNGGEPSHLAERSAPAAKR
jgi:hypothetical protein